MHPDVEVGLPIHGELRGNQHVGVLELGQLLSPVRLLEFEEERPQDLRVVKRRLGDRLHLCRRQLRTRPGRLPVLSAARKSGTNDVRLRQNRARPLTDFFLIEAAGLFCVPGGKPLREGGFELGTGEGAIFVFIGRREKALSEESSGAKRAGAEPAPAALARTAAGTCAWTATRTTAGSAAGQSEHVTQSSRELLLAQLPRL